jgi:hypothetical protein
LSYHKYSGWRGWWLGRKRGGLKAEGGGVVVKGSVRCVDLCTHANPYITGVIWAQLEALMMTRWVETCSPLISYYSIASLLCIGEFDWHVLYYIDFKRLRCRNSCNLQLWGLQTFKTGKRLFNIHFRTWGQKSQNVLLIDISEENTLQHFYMF